MTDTDAPIVLQRSGGSTSRYGNPVRAECACGETWVFLGWPMRPCGRCWQRVTIDLSTVRERSDSE